MEDGKYYTEHYGLETQGGWIGLCICKLCGATIMIDTDNAKLVHQKWHESTLKQTN